MSKSPAEVIAEKGHATIADRLGMKPETVRMWRFRNRIPRSVWPELAGAFPDLDLATLREIETRAGRAA